MLLDSRPVMESFYKYHLFFCTNQRQSGRACCGNHHAQSLRDHMKVRIKELGLTGQGGIRVNTAGCMDRCAMGPALVVYPEATWYRYQNEQDIEEIIKTHLQNGQIVNRLLLE